MRQTRPSPGHSNPTWAPATRTARGSGPSRAETTGTSCSRSRRISWRRSAVLGSGARSRTRKPSARQAPSAGSSRRSWPRTPSIERVSRRYASGASVRSTLQSTRGRAPSVSSAAASGAPGREERRIRHRHRSVGRQVVPEPGLRLGLAGQHREDQERRDRPRGPLGGGIEGPERLDVVPEPARPAPAATPPARRRRRSRRGAPTGRPPSRSRRARSRRPGGARPAPPGRRCRRRRASGPDAGRRPGSGAAPRGRRAGTITHRGSPRRSRPRIPARPASSSRAPASRQRAACGTGIRTTSPGAFRPSAPAKARRSSRVRSAVGSSATTTTAGRLGGRSAARARDAAEPHRPSSWIRPVARPRATRARARSPQASRLGGLAVGSVAVELALTAAPAPGGRKGSPARSTGRRSGGARPSAP